MIIPTGDRILSPFHYITAYAGGHSSASSTPELLPIRGWVTSLGQGPHFRCIYSLLSYHSCIQSRNMSTVHTVAEQGFGIGNEHYDRYELKLLCTAFVIYLQYALQCTSILPGDCERTHSQVRRSQRPTERRRASFVFLD